MVQNTAGLIQHFVNPAVSKYLLFEPGKYEAVEEEWWAPDFICYAQDTVGVYLNDNPPFFKERQFCDFLFASLDNIALSKWGQLLQERICSHGANSFLEMLIPIGKGGKWNGRVTSPESKSAHLKVYAIPCTNILNKNIHVLKSQTIFEITSVKHFYSLW